MSAGRSIQGLLTRWLALQTLAGLSLICASIYAVTAWSFHLKQDDGFERGIGMVRHLIEEFGDDLDEAKLRHRLEDGFAQHQGNAIVLRRDGEIIYSDTPAGSAARWIWRNSEWQDARQPGSHLQLQVGLDVQEDARLLRRLGWTLLAAVLLGTLLVSLTGALLVRRGLRPLKALARQTADTGPAHPGRRIDAAHYAAELQPWVAQFNAVLERAELAYGQLESFNADVAHELQTPLANLVGEIEVELVRLRSVEELRDRLLSNLEEARRLSSIVKAMLFLSQADRGALALRSEPASLAQQVRAVVEFHEAALEAGDLQVDIQGDARAAVDVSLLRRAIANLLGNAMRYSPARSRIAVTIEAQGAWVWLTVGNQGPAIAPDALPHLFKRFFRAERSRVGSSEHHGLGLAIVAAIARMHGGQTRAASGGGRTEIGFSIHIGPGSPGTAGTQV
ncbi:heavy metal sensor histidine kinase [Variovorax sp. LARHSF232]